MSLKILFVTATSAEAEALRQIPGLIPDAEAYRFGSLEINLLITGVGSVATAWSMLKWIPVNDKPDLAINTGIAGSYLADLKIGDVVMPVTDCFADAGIEDGGNFFTLFEADLTGADDFPYTGGLLPADLRYTESLRKLVKPVRAITVNTSTGSHFTREKLVGKFNPDIETMEGATFFYICRREKIPFFALRGISNMVEIRNRDKWNIPLALKNLSEKLNEVVLTLR